MPRRTLLTTLPLALALGGCASEGVFTCADDQACAGAGPGARCEPSGWCSFEDEACADGHRYAEGAGDGLGGVCVGEEGGTLGTTTSSPTTMSDPSLDGTTEPSETTTTTTSTSDDTGPPVQEPWWDCGWAARRELVLDVPDTGEVLAGFPVLVVLDASRIDAAIMAPDGHDLRFVAEDDATVLSHEIEQWAPDGLSWAWVRVPELHPGQNRLTMYYGNPTAPPLPGAEVWSGYAGVWHMGPELADATGASEAGQGAATGAAGQAGLGLRFVPPEDGIAVTPGAALGGLFVQGGTLTAMIRASGWGANGQGLVVGRADTPNGDGGWVLSVDGSRNALRFARGFTTNRRTWFSPEGSLSLHAWHHVALVYQDDPAGDPSLYIDGTPQPLSTQGTGNGSPEPDDAPVLHLGGEPSSFEQTFDGILDEVRAAAVPRSPAWLTVEVASLRDELATYGPPQSSPCP